MEDLRGPGRWGGGERGRGVRPPATLAVLLILLFMSSTVSFFFWSIEPTNTNINCQVTVVSSSATSVQSDKMLRSSPRTTTPLRMKVISKLNYFGLYPQSVQVTSVPMKFLTPTGRKVVEKGTDVKRRPKPKLARSWRGSTRKVIWRTFSSAQQRGLN